MSHDTKRAFHDWLWNGGYDTGGRPIVNEEVALIVAFADAHTNKLQEEIHELRGRLTHEQKGEDT